MLLGTYIQHTTNGRNNDLFIYFKLDDLSGQIYIILPKIKLRKI